MNVTPVRFAPLLALVLAAVHAVSVCAESTPVEQGRAALGRGDIDAAVEILEKAVAQTPASAEAHFYLATAYGGAAQAKGMFGGASLIPKMKAEYEKAIALNPKYVEPRYGLVEFYTYAPGIAGGSFDKALEQAKEIKAIDPVVGHRAYAFIYSKQEKLDLAKKELQDAIREEPRSAKARSYFGQYLVNTEKNYPAAFAEFEAALKVDPGYMPAFYHLGRAASLANANLARGEEGVKKYLAYTPKANEPALANAHYVLGVIYEKQGKTAEAKRSFETALQLNPSLKQASEALKRVS